MKKFHPLKAILIASIGYLIVACDKEKPDSSNNLNGDWKVISYENYETSVIITKTTDNTWEQFNNGDVTLKFSSKNLTTGLITGIEVTIGFSCNYIINDKGEIKISNFIQTEINEPEWGNLFDSITHAETFEVNNERLIIFCNKKKNSITLEKLHE